MSKPKTKQPKEKQPKEKQSEDDAASQDVAITGSHADYEVFEPAALKLPPADVFPMRADLQLALHNTTAGVSAVLAEEKRLSKLPETNVGELRTLPRLILATIFADTQIDRSGTPRDLKRLLTRCSELRALLLTTAESLAVAGLLKKSVVAEIRAGRGKLDAARDCIALAALFQKNAKAIRGKHPITAAQIQEASTVGTQLVEMLKTKRSRRDRTVPVAAADIRDRLWTLVLRRYDALWRAGAYLFGRDEVDEKVIPLQANRGGRPKKEKGADAKAADAKAKKGAKPADAAATAAKGGDAAKGDGKADGAKGDAGTANGLAKAAEAKPAEKTP